MNLQEYQSFVVSTWSDDSHDAFRSLYIATAGLGGETGEALEWLKKNVRDGKKDTDDLALELGDILYYLTILGRWHGYDLEEIMLMNMDKLKKRKHNKENKS